MNFIKIKHNRQSGDGFGEEQAVSPLWKAMLQGDEETVKLLIEESGADPDERCRVKSAKYRDHTFLQYVASYDKEPTEKMLKVSEVLINHGANLHTVDSYCNPFEIALRHNNVRFVEFALKNGAELPLRQEDQACLVQTVCKRKFHRKEMMLLLIEYGLDTGFVNEFGENLLHTFIRYCVDKSDDDAVSVAKIILEQPTNGITVDGVDVFNCSPLHLSVSKQNIPLIKFFLKNGAIVSRLTTDLFRESPLDIAAKNNNVEIIYLLVSNGADVHAQNGAGLTALHSACLIHNENAIYALLQKGADVNASNSSGQTPFFTTLLSDSNFKGLNNDCSKIIIREFSKLSYENFFVTKKDMDRVQVRPETRKYFEKCVAEVNQMAKTVFHAPFSYYTVMKMSRNNIKKLALLTKNEEFLANFEANLKSFSCFEKDLRRVLEDATQVKNQLGVVESRLKYIYGDYFPFIVIKKLADKLSVDDLPLD